MPIATKDLEVLWQRPPDYGQRRDCALQIWRQSMAASESGSPVGSVWRWAPLPWLPLGPPTPPNKQKWRPKWGPLCGSPSVRQIEASNSTHLCCTRLKRAPQPTRTSRHTRWSARPSPKSSDHLVSSPSCDSDKTTQHNKRLSFLLIRAMAVSYSNFFQLSNRPARVWAKLRREE